MKDKENRRTCFIQALQPYLLVRLRYVHQIGVILCNEHGSKLKCVFLVKIFNAQLPDLGEKWADKADVG